MESMYEYGSRVGIWRILRVLRDAQVPATIFACAEALEANPRVTAALLKDGHELCSHGHRWEEVFRLSREEEREHIDEAVRTFERIAGKRPVGWYCRYGPSIHTRELLVGAGGFLYDSDSYNDDLPYFVTVNGKRHLVVPYAPDNNDLGFWLSSGPATSAEFLQYLTDSFDTLYEESAESAQMMSIGLHCRIIGRPGRIRSLQEFIAYAQQKPGVWFATREDIARFWHSQDVGENP
jgi:peptidoglycan/xylan/chitin deacetylase (PgdA/CDA1 family)